MKPLGLLLAPGAGADRDQPSLVALDAAASAAGVVVRRMDFPYRKAGRRAPDRAPVLIAAVVEEYGALAAEADPVLVGGRSMGGRMCSMAVADGLGAAGLVLVSYPLHPPGKPERRRDEHFGDLAVPCLFVSGTRDAFATPDELAEATAKIPGPVTRRQVEGGDHGLRGKDRVVTELAGAWIAERFPDHWHPPGAPAES